MRLTIKPKKLSGRITPPPSKSAAHRLILGAALAGGRSVIENFAPSEDMDATLGAVRALGASAAADGSRLVIDGVLNKNSEIPHIDCGESGSTLRFLIPIALALCGGGVFSGRGRLMQRSLGPYFELFQEKGINWEAGGQLTVRGRLESGAFRIRGDVSSQFITGLLFALPLLDGDSALEVSTALESRGYIDITLDVLRQFDIIIENEDYRKFKIPGNQRYASGNFAVEADWSQAAFFLVAAELGAEIELDGLPKSSVQGDATIVDIIKKVNSAEAETELDMRDVPDLVPIVALLLALKPGLKSRIVNVARLRDKESDRLSAVSGELNSLGAKIRERPDGLDIVGVERLRGGAADSHNDHRIAMTLAVAAMCAEGEVTLDGAESVNKSYPAFWSDYSKLGGEFR